MAVVQGNLGGYYRGLVGEPISIIPHLPPPQNLKPISIMSHLPKSYLLYLAESKGGTFLGTELHNLETTPHHMSVVR